jgi:hypothetical protein
MEDQELHQGGYWKIAVENQYKTEAVEYRTSTLQEKQYKIEGVQSKERPKKVDSEILRTDRIPQEKGSLRKIQEPEYRTERIKSLVYAV